MHTVQFQNWDGTVVSKKTYHYGDMVEVPADPARPDSVDSSFDFTGWDREIIPYDVNAVYTAVYAFVWLSGAFNSDEIVTDDDAMYLLRYTLFPERYPVPGDADVNSDGVVTDDDAMYLLRYTLFPDRYPLYPQKEEE